MATKETSLPYIHSSITVTAPSVANVQAVIEQIYPLVYEFKKHKEIKKIPRRSYSGDGEEGDDVKAIYSVVQQVVHYILLT